jgi:hypothetical protein
MNGNTTPLLLLPPQADNSSETPSSAGAMKRWVMQIPRVVIREVRALRTISGDAI